MPITLQQQDLDDLVVRIVRAAPVRRIVLFGSAAGGQLGDHSDLDVLAVVPTGTHRRNTTNDIYRQLRGFRWATDVVVATEEDLEWFGQDPSLVYRSALAEGTVLYAA